MGAHPRRDAARDGPRPQAGPRRARLRPPARGLVPDREAAAVHRAARADRRARGAVEGRGRRAEHVALPGRRRGARRHRRRSRPRPACRPTTRSGSGPTGCGRRSATPWTRCRGSDAQPRGPLARLAGPVPDRPLGPRRGGTDHHGPRRAAAPRLPGPRRAGRGLPRPLLRRDAGDDGRGLSAPPGEAGVAGLRTHAARPRRGRRRAPGRDPGPRRGEVRRRHRAA